MVEDLLQWVTALPWVEILVVVVILALAVKIMRGLLEIVIPIAALVAGYYFVTRVAGYSFDLNAIKDAVIGWLGSLTG